MLVKKKDNSVRFCVDYRLLNKLCYFDPMLSPLPEYLYSKLSPNNYFSKLDLSKGYWQIPLKPEDRDKTTFVTSDSGLYRFKVVPFGLVTSATNCNRMMELLLKTLKNVASYVDDILAFTKDWDSHVSALRDLFQELRKANLSIRPSKCVFGFQNIEFLGHTVGTKGLAPCEDKVMKVQNAPLPRTKKELW